jgi:hypothetical protein
MIVAGIVALLHCDARQIRSESSLHSSAAKLHVTHGLRRVWQTEERSEGELDNAIGVGRLIAPQWANSIFHRSSIGSNVGILRLNAYPHASREDKRAAGVLAATASTWPRVGRQGRISRPD